MNEIEMFYLIIVCLGRLYFKLFYIYKRKRLVLKIYKVIKLVLSNVIKLY